MVARGLGARKDKEKKHREFLEGETIPYSFVMVDI